MKNGQSKNKTIIEEKDSKPTQSDIDKFFG